MGSLRAGQESWPPVSGFDTSYLAHTVSWRPHAGPSPRCIDEEAVCQRGSHTVLGRPGFSLLAVRFKQQMATPCIPGIPCQPAHCLLRLTLSAQTAAPRTSEEKTSSLTSAWKTFFEERLGALDF